MNFDFSRFFYNILPGSFFIVFWLINKKYWLDSIKEKTELFDRESVLFVMFIVFSLLLGIILHGIWRLIIYILQKTFSSSREPIYNKNVEIWAKELQALPEFFSMRAAMWGSIIVGLIISWLFIKIYNEYWYYYILLLIIFWCLFFMDKNKTEDTINRIYDRNIKK